MVDPYQPELGAQGYPGPAGSVDGGTPTSQVTTGKASWDVDTSGLVKLRTALAAVVTELGNLNTAIDGINKKLGGMGVGGGSTGGSKNMAAPVSAFANNRTIGMAAAGEIGAQWSGQVNTWMNQFQSGGVPIQLMAAQTAAMTGTTTTAATSAFIGIKNQSPQDLAQAMSMYQQNPLLSTIKPGSKNYNNLKQFLNTSQGLNPAEGAAGALGLANTLTSNQAQWFMQMRGMASRGGGLFNAVTGNINSPNQVYKTLVEALTGSKNVTPGQAQAWAANPRTMMMMQQNAGMMGISPSQMVQVHQYMSAGMNLNAAMNANGASIKGTVASTLLGRTTAGTQTQMDVFQATAGMQNEINQIATGFQKVGGDLATFAPTVVMSVAGMAKLTSVATALTARFLELSAAAGGIKGMLGANGPVGEGEGPVGEGEEQPTGGPDSPMPSGLGSLGLGSMKTPLAIGLAGNLAGMGLSIAGSHVGGTAGKVISRAGGVLSGAATGAMIGTMFDPESMGLGTVIGGGVGALAGALGLLGDPITGSTNTSGMQPNLARGVNAMMAANPNLQINSGYRTKAQQAALYALKGGQGVAPPGQSAHQTGRAADIGPSSQLNWVAANASKFGLYRPAPSSEPWHVQAMGDPATGSTVTGVASSELGIPYSWGGGGSGGPSLGIKQGANTVGFDCSGLVQYVFAQVGVKLPRTSQAQAKMGTAIKSISQAQPGDLVFFAGSDGSASNPGHVGIYIGGGKMIDAPYTGQVVRTESVSNAGTVVAIRRVLGGGAGGSSVVAAAQASVGSPSNDSHGGATAGTAIGLTNTFIAGLAGSWLSGGGPVGGGGGAAPGTATATGTAPTTGGGTSTSGGSAAASTTVTVPTSGKMTSAQVMAAWIKAGGPAGLAKTMAGIAMAESSDEPGIVQKGEPYSQTGWGLWQITPGNSEPQVGVNQALLDPVTNAQAALAKYRGAGSTLRPWRGDHYLVGNNINPDSSGIGDPVGVAAFTPPTGGNQNTPSTVFGSSQRGRPVTVNINATINTQQDANNVIQMMAAAVQQNQDLQAVSNS